MLETGLLDEQEQQNSSAKLLIDNSDELPRSRTLSVYSDKSDRKSQQILLEKQKSSADEMIKISFTDVRFTVTL